MQADIAEYYSRRKVLRHQYNVEDKRLCKCDRCSERCDHAPVWEREVYFTRRTCSRHMSAQRTEHSGKDPSFYKLQEVLDQLQADLRIPKEAVDRIELEETGCTF